jgi:hypothetical protein
MALGLLGRSYVEAEHMHGLEERHGTREWLAGGVLFCWGKRIRGEDLEEGLRLTTFSTGLLPF